MLVTITGSRWATSSASADPVLALCRWILGQAGGKDDALGRLEMRHFAAALPLIVQLETAPQAFERGWQAYRTNLSG